MTVIVLRGPGGAGKTTLGEALQEHLGYPTAHIDTDLFNWTIVPGEGNKRVVFDATRSLAELYIRNGYNVIVSGLILTTEESGGMELLAAATRFYGHRFFDFYCQIDLETALRRSHARPKVIPPADIQRWWKMAHDDVVNVTWTVHHIDMTRSVAQLVADVSAICETEGRVRSTEASNL